MKRTLILAAGFAALLGAPTIAEAAHRTAGISIHVGAFYRPLASYGQWIEVEPGFVVWRPRYMRSGWRPYMEGRWVWSDYGWYWVSVEPFGWAVYHYGRWHYDEYYGWVWIPDNVWGPAWVEWRYNDAYIGWAPLPPYASFHVTYGIRFTRTWMAPHHYWSFVDVHRFGRDVRYRDYADANDTRRLVGTTRSGGGYEIDRNRIVNRGIDRSFVEQRSGGRFERTEIRTGGTTRGERFVRDGERRPVIEAYRPSDADFQRADAPRATVRGERRLDLDVNAIERTQRSPSEFETPRRVEQRDRRETTPVEPSEQIRRPTTTPSAPDRTRPTTVQPDRRTGPDRVTTPDRSGSRVRPSSPAPATREQPQRSAAPRRDPPSSSSSSTTGRDRRRN
ncbi:MAG: hypothetical protein MUE68_08355 [Bacteroidetes bacterium]|jgi:hypothetical protein|nr:hypothetical protein [Bacteroidota bacterium]